MCGGEFVPANPLTSSGGAKRSTIVRAEAEAKFTSGTKRENQSVGSKSRKGEKGTGISQLDLLYHLGPNRHAWIPVGRYWHAYEGWGGNIRLTSQTDLSLHDNASLAQRSINFPFISRILERLRLYLDQ